MIHGELVLVGDQQASPQTDGQNQLGLPVDAEAAHRTDEHQDVRRGRS